MSEAFEFLSALFGTRPEGSHMLIWTLPDKRSVWVTDIDLACKEAVRLADKHDVYVGAGLSPADYGPAARCKSEDVLGLSGLWLDLDIAGAGHRKSNLPPDEKAAHALLEEIPLPPSLLVHSGHGLQAWWLFREPWAFDKPEERAEATELSRAWSYTWKARSKAHGWDVDSVWDLARVLRVPGTMNWKSEPVPVRLLENRDNRYDPRDFDFYLADASFSVPAPAVPVSANGLELRNEASPPFDKFLALKEAEVKFGQSWDRKRKDLQDQSASAYDLSLASYAAMAGWPDQEIIDLLVAWRRRHGEDLKLRVDYYARTIGRARSGVGSQVAVSEMASESDHAGKITQLSKALGVKISRVIKYMSDPPLYRLVIAGKTMALGTVENLVTQKLLRNKLAALAGHYMPEYKQDRWSVIAQTLLDVCEEITVSEDATESGAVKGWLSLYLTETSVTDTIEEAAPFGRPFRKEGRVHLIGSGFRRYLKIQLMEQITAREMGSMLREAGCEPVTVAYQGTSGWSTRATWVLPENL